MALLIIPKPIKAPDRYTWVKTLANSLNKLDEYLWQSGRIVNDMREMDTERLEAILGWIEKMDRKSNNLVMTKQYAWVRHELNASWGWRRWVKRRRLCYETQDELAKYESKGEGDGQKG